MKHITTLTVTPGTKVREPFAAAIMQSATTLSASRLASLSLAFGTMPAANFQSNKKEGRNCDTCSLLQPAERWRVIVQFVQRLETVALKSRSNENSQSAITKDEAGLP